jgi:hypothetical protein
VSLLIIESGDHLGLAPAQLRQGLREDPATKIFFPSRRSTREFLRAFPDLAPHCLPCRGWGDILGMLASARSFDRILILTFFEYVGFNSRSLLQVLWSSFFMLSVGSRCVLLLRNWNSYLPLQNLSRPSRFLRALFLRFALFRSKEIAFEYRCIVDHARKAASIFRRKSTCLVYMAYEAEGGLRTRAPFPRADGRVTVVLTGQFNSGKRDLALVRRLLAGLRAQKVDWLEFQLSSYHVDHEYLAELRRDFPDFPFLERKKGESYRDVMQKGDCLFAPLLENAGYGVTKGTGAFADAILFARKVILPRFTCTSDEFDKISIFYHNEKELLSVFLSLPRANCVTLNSGSFCLLPKY